MTDSCTIKKIAEWEDSGEVEIPALQRGLVWAPEQVELLWDSLLRGFPIGAFVVTKVRGAEKQSKRCGEGSSKYFLLDGQQRYNAIKAALAPWDDNSNSVLWIDMMPPERSSSTRRYWIKVTTKAHPWGYGNDDNCSVLGWATYRSALSAFGYSPDTNVRNVNLGKAWPIKAGCPVPFRLVIEMYEATKDKGADAFINRIENWIRANKNVGACSNKRNFELIDKVSHQVFYALRRLHDYRIAMLELSHDALEEQDVAYGDSDDVTSNLEQLFTRLNTLGTPISPYDLRYSAIKAYWGDIAKSNDDVAAKIMPASHLAVFAFRLAESLSGNAEKFPDVPSVQKIRSFGKKRDSEVCRKIEQLYADDGQILSGYIHAVESALDVSKNGQHVSGLPAVLRTSIAINTPDLYLMLLYAAAKGRIAAIRNPTAIVLWLKWCSVSPLKKVVDAFKPVIDGVGNYDTQGLFKSLTKDGSVLPPISAADFGDEKRFFDKNVDWTKFEEEPWYRVFNQLWKQEELVIYATRKYFNSEFQYDPAETKFLTGHNKPWDIDHIIPKVWASRQRVEMGDWQRACLEWIWSIGNFAPIPFSANRSKSDKGMFELYKEHYNDLFFDERIKDIEDCTVTKDDNMARKFISATYSRMKAMYSEIQKQVDGLLK